MKAKSILGKSVEEIKSALEQHLSDEFKPTLAIVFMLGALDWEGLLALLDKQGMDVFGATTEIVFTDKGIKDHGISILLLDMNRANYKIVLKEFESDSAMKAAGQIGEIGINTFTNPAFIISGSLRDWPGELLMDGITDKIGKEVKIIGGMAGDVATFSGIIFTNNQSCDQGIIALIVDHDKIELNGLAVSGFTAVGTKKVVTKSEGGWIHKIDDKPAMEVIWQFIGRDIEETKISDQLVMLNTSYPLLISREIGNPVMRPTVMYNTQTKAIFCGGYVREGTSFRFSLPPDFEVIDTVLESSKSIKQNKMEEADALLVFSCVSRYSMFGPLIEQENIGLAEVWNAPMAGFFSLGEFGKVVGGEVPEYHGGTCSWVALKEK